MTQYRLRTIKDIFNKVPLDRIEDCMKELTTLLITSKGMCALVRESFSTAAGVRLPKMHTLPEELVWDDDGKGEVEARIPIPVVEETLVIRTTHSGATAD